ncbi:hypothetical protein [Paraburkholderia humisilvae]|uniref:Uncharacterized protein n=1 Tax=Paraburkholderia humisilvae TaxID=627669 RepID=A0A6J5FAX7_9BURK|nr:hypothetical protein [Paraburkholderia humisilvae]CAB3774376.1 hypothetical protein LMG29542_07761 [Paraburkholderia humisilvae]
MGIDNLRALMRDMHNVRSEAPRIGERKTAQTLRIREAVDEKKIGNPRLAALVKTQMADDLRRKVGRDNMQTFSVGQTGGPSSRSRLVAERLIAPYANYLKNSEQLGNRKIVEILRGMVNQLGKPALAQHLDNPQQYVSHGFDHSERVADYTVKILKAYPEIEQSAAEKYNVSRDVASLLFQILAHWHDIGYSELDGRPKPTHGLSSASRFDDGVFSQLRLLIGRENGRAELVLSDMRKAIQLHSADVSAKSYPINVKTDRGSLLVRDVDSLDALLSHYSTSSRRPQQVSKIEIRGADAKAIGTHVNDILKARPHLQSVKVTAHEEKSAYTGRPTSLDKEGKVNVGLRYTEQELTENPFAVIRLADNLDMAADRLSPLQRSPAFRAIYWTLGDRGLIGRTLAELASLDDRNTTDVPDILRNLQSAAAGSGSIEANRSTLSDVAGSLADARQLDAATARQLLVKATVDSILRSPIAQDLSETDRSDLRDVGYRINGESIHHFGGVEAIENIDVKRGKIIVTVNVPLYRKLNELKGPVGVGIGEYQIERARQAFSSLTIDGKRPEVVMVGSNTEGA